MNVEQKFSNGDPINSYNAVAYAEGFAENQEPTLTDQLAAWAYLIRTGMCWSLQGHFGRTASSLMQEGLITPAGEIDWNMVDQHLEQ